MGAFVVFGVFVVLGLIAVIFNLLTRPKDGRETGPMSEADVLRFKKRGNWPL